MAEGLFGFDPEQLQAMMAQFGATEQERKDANNQALFALGFGLLGGRKGNELGTIGNAGLNALQYRSGLLADIPKQKAEQFQAGLQMMKLNQAAQQMADQQRMQGELTKVFQGGPQLQNMGPGGPTPQNAASIAPPSIANQYRQAAALYAAQGKTEDAKRLTDIANSAEAEYSTTPQTMMQGGKPVSVLLGKRGETKVLEGLSPAEKLQFLNTGGAQVGVNPYTGVPAASLPTSMTPGEQASNAVARAHLAIAQAAERRAAENQGKPQWDAGSGQFVYPPSKQAPEGAAVTPSGFTKQDKPLTESQAKASAFANQMADASRVIAELSDKGFTGETAAQQGAIRGAAAEGFPFVPGSAAIPRLLAGDNAQKYQQAELQWTEGALRFMTGANAPKEEVIRNAATYFPRPGDSPATVKRKEEARRNMEASIRLAAGAGTKQLPTVGGGSGWKVELIPQGR